MNNNSIIICGDGEPIIWPKVEDVVLFGLKELNICDKDITIDITELDGVFGYCYGDGDDWSIDIETTLDWPDMIETILHELVHIKQGEMFDKYQKEKEAEYESARLFREYAELL